MRYRPTADAAFSLNRFPSRMYFINTVMLLWTVVSATGYEQSGATAVAATASRRATQPA